MKSSKPTDCVLFINEEIARLVIAWNRVDTDGPDAVELPEIKAKYSPQKIAEAMNISTGQVRSLVKQCVIVGVIIESGEISDLAQKLVNALIAKKSNDFK
jgi:hypothetical protein